MLESFFRLHRSDRHLLLAFCLLGVIVLSAFWLFDAKQMESTETETAIADSTQSEPMAASSVIKKPAERFPFDPNTADSSAFLRLGLQPWQIHSIMNYRAKGGIYRTKEDFARVYQLTLKEYRELEPYIHISEDYQPAVFFVKEKPALRDTLRHPLKLTEGTTVDLCSADTSLLKRVPGIGPYYAHKIVDFRQRLGGFVSVDQLDEIEGFPVESKKYFVITTPSTIRLNLNKLSLNELRRHPYINYYQARTIVEYRRQHGPLTSLDDLQLCSDFPEDVRQRLAPYVEF